MYTLAKYLEEAKVSGFPDWFSETQMVNPLFPEDPFNIRWHQVTGLNLTMIHQRSALYDDMGTGKSIISQAWTLFQVGIGNKVVCLMPPVLLGQYRDSLIATFKGIEERFSIKVFRGTKKQRQKMLNEWTGDARPDIVLMTYAIFTKEGCFFDDYTALMADEASLANPNTASNQALIYFMGNVGQKNCLVLNGTPAMNDLRDLYGFIEFICPETYRSQLHFNTCHVEFKDIQTRVQLKNGEIGKRPVSIVSKFDNLEQLYKNLYKQGRRVEKSQVLELKEKNVMPFSFELSEKHHLVYKKMVTELLLEFEDGSILNSSTSAGLRNNAMQCIFRPNILGIDEVSTAFEALEYLVERSMSKSKVLIFCHYRATVEAICKFFEKLNPAMIYGGSNVEKQKDKFLKDPTCRLAVANYRSGGVGLNLQGVCSEVIAAEPTTIPGFFDQSVDRVYRSGQRDVVNVYVLLPKGTVFVKAVYDMLKKRASNASVVSRDFIYKELMGDPAAGQYVQEEEVGQDLAPGWESL